MGPPDKFAAKPADWWPWLAEIISTPTGPDVPREELAAFASAPWKSPALGRNQSWSSEATPQRLSRYMPTAPRARRRAAPSRRYPLITCWISPAQQRTQDEVGQFVNWEILPGRRLHKLETECCPGNEVEQKGAGVQDAFGCVPGINCSLEYGSQCCSEFVLTPMETPGNLFVGAHLCDERWHRRRVSPAPLGSADSPRQWHADRRAVFQ